MPTSGRRSGHPAGRLDGTRVGLLVVLLATATPDLLGGCTTTALPSEEQALRQAAIERWSRCVERRSEAFAEAVVLDETGGRVESGCEGHRRDVVHAFPPHMEHRLERALDERAVRRSRKRLHGRLRNLPPDILVQRLFGTHPPD